MTLPAKSNRPPRPGRSGARGGALAARGRARGRAPGHQGTSAARARRDREPAPPYHARSGRGAQIRDQQLRARAPGGRRQSQSRPGRGAAARPRGDRVRQEPGRRHRAHGEGAPDGVRAASDRQGDARDRRQVRPQPPPGDVRGRNRRAAAGHRGPGTAAGLYHRRSPPAPGDGGGRQGPGEHPCAGRRRRASARGMPRLGGTAGPGEWVDTTA